MTNWPERLTDSDIIEQVQLLKHDHMITWPEIAEQAGLSTATLHGLINNNYKGDTAAQMAILRRWITPLVRPSAYDIVMTETTQIILRHLDRAYMARQMYAITGKSGFSKTFTAQYFAMTHLRAYHVNGRVTLGEKNMMLEILRSARIRGGKTKNTYEMQNLIIEYFSTRAALLIIDEADKLPIKSLDALREIYDQSPNLGIVFMGEPAFSAKLRTPDRNGLSPDRIYNRIHRFIEIDPISVDDVEAFFRHHGIQGISKSGRAYIVKSINRIGGYRRLQDITNDFLLRFEGSEGRRTITEELAIDVLKYYPD